MPAQSEEHVIEPVWSREESIRKGYDHIPVRIGSGRGYGYIGLESGAVGLTRCPVCERENHAMSVSYGQCCWCGWEMPKTEIESE